MLEVMSQGLCPVLFLIIFEMMYSCKFYLKSDQATYLTFLGIWAKDSRKSGL